MKCQMCLVFGVLVWLGGTACSQTTTSAQEAQKLSVQSGKPILALSVRANSPSCQELQQLLESDFAIKSLAARFIVLNMDYDGAEYARWASQYPTRGTTVPIIQVVSSTGQDLYRGWANRAVQELGQTLSDGLENAGRSLPPEEVFKALQSVDRSLKAGRVQEAAQLLGTQAFQSPLYSRELMARAHDLSMQAGKEIKAVQDRLVSGQGTMTDFVRLYELRRCYQALPEAVALFQEALDLIQVDAEMTPLLEQGESLEAAQQLAQAEKWLDAIPAYEKLIQNYPGTQAAELARAELSDIQAEQEKKQRRTTLQPKTSEESEKKAESLLRLGKQLQSKQPEKAREYFEKTIEAAPGSTPAKEAEELLKQL